MRKAGILLHPTSLPSSAGIGTLGRPAFQFVDFLERAGMRLWQVLPLGPTGYGDSPYQSFSAFALNPLLIDFDDLLERGWTTGKIVRKPGYIKTRGNVDFGSVVWWKSRALKETARHFLGLITNPAGGGFDPGVKAAFFSFCRENQFWLRDYAAFMSIKNFYDEKARKERERTGKAVSGSWNVYWPKKLARHDDAAVEEWINGHTEEFLEIEAVQFFALTQWNALHEYARSKGVEIVGDIPIFVAPDSSDVWANQRLFQIGRDGSFTAVAGVPPDYFSATGQLWGNPLYNWKNMKKDGYRWWIARIKKMLSLVDLVRVDHFRGFESYWAVPAGSKTAETGEWEKGPGIALFDAVRKELGDLPLIAEDLGVITDEVRALLDAAAFPGMKVLQFGLDKNEWRGGALRNVFLPHNFSTTNCVAYTGTHDNDTTQGLLESLDDDALVLAADYFTGERNTAESARRLLSGKRLCRAFVRAVFASTADIAVVPLQDVYALGSDARMNMPGSSGANWSWRATERQISDEGAAAWLRNLAVLYAR